ncbi:MAG: hypothetical protein HKP58_11925, partial [Desulfatitalea sp.]|nr:hypothetical protein [Desulfatitalea sp.]NNK01110.1 hypothetical protein [Desulfatitalea sp.]
MREYFYRWLSFASKFLGPGFFRFIARCIAGGYFVLLPKRTAVSMHFYSALWPGRHRRFYLACAWRQFQNFTSVFLDRHLLQHGKTMTYTFEGRQHLHQALEAGQGGRDVGEVDPQPLVLREGELL